MSNFTTELKLEYFDDFMFKLEFYDNDIVGLKKEAIVHYKDTLRKSATLTSKIVGQLMSTWIYGGTPFDEAKDSILSLTKFALKNITLHIPLEVYRVMLMLTFPLFVEIMQIIAAYGDNIFTVDMIIDQIHGNYGADTTKEEAVKKALLTMCEVGMVQRYKKGIYRLKKWPVFNVLGVVAVLYAAEAMAKNYSSTDNPIMKGVSMEINHEFVDYFSQIDYACIVGEKLWKDFLSKNDEKYCLQLHDNQWSISSSPLLYPHINVTIDKIPARLKLNVRELEDYYLKAENEKKNKSIAEDEKQ